MNRAIERYLSETFSDWLKRPSQVLLIAGPSSLNLEQTTGWLGRQLTDSPQRITTIKPDGASIKIEQVRPLYRATHQRQSRGEQTRTIVIEAAHLMTKPAQNALLKLLEEPPGQVHFILATADLAQVTPTIRSRSHIIELPRLNKTRFTEFFSDDWSGPEVERRYLLSQGDPISAVHIDQLETSVEQAKRLLSAPLADVAAELSKQNPGREEVLAWCRGLSLICQSALAGAGNQTEIKRWLGRSRAVLRASDLLLANASHKLTLNWLLLELRQ